MKLRLILLVGMLTVCLIHCFALGDGPPPAKQKPAATKPPEISKDHAAQMAKGLDVFKKHVRPVLVQNCLRCHGGKSIKSEFNLADRDGLLEGGRIGPAVVPGKAKES